MEDIYQKKYPEKELIKIIQNYFKDWGKYWSVAVGVYMVLFICGCFFLFTHIHQVTILLINKNPEMMKAITEVNLSGTQTFVLNKFILMVVVEVLLSVVVVFLILSFVYDLVNIFVFVSMDLFCREEKTKLFPIFKYILTRFPAICLTNIVLRFYYLLIIIISIAVWVLTDFLVPMNIARIYFTAVIAFICLLAVNWCFVYQAVYKYKVNGNKAIAYSIKLIKKFLKDVVLWTTCNKGFNLLLIVLLSQLLEGKDPSSYPLLLTVILTIIMIYSFLNKLYTNVLFINRDYLYRESTEESELYTDLITKHLAPLKKKSVRDYDPLRRTRRRTVGHMFHRYHPVEKIKEETVKKKKSKKKKPKEKAKPKT